MEIYLLKNLVLPQLIHRWQHCVTAPVKVTMFFTSLVEPDLFKLTRQVLYATILCPHVPYLVHQALYQARLKIQYQNCFNLTNMLLFSFQFFFNCFWKY